jgi:hypothetical protein
MLFWEIVLTRSPIANPSAESFAGSVSTSIAGVTAPLAVAVETPPTCSIAGKMLFVTSAEGLSVFEETESVATVGSPGSNELTEGAVRSVGSTDCAACTRSCTWTRSAV